MTLPASGPISFNNINVELGVAGTTQASLGQASYRALAGVASGAISMSNFYGKANAFNGTISSNQTNLNLRTWALANGWNGTTAATITVASGVWVYSTSTGSAGLVIDGSWPGGITLINDGYIAGMGGNGGVKGAGGAGGVAISLGVNCNITNNSYIGGGGGGGGQINTFWISGAGGGAGGGAGSTAGGLAGSIGAGGAGGGPNASGVTGGTITSAYSQTGVASGGGGGGAGGGGGGSVILGNSGNSSSWVRIVGGGGGGGRIFPGSGGSGGNATGGFSRAIGGVGGGGGSAGGIGNRSAGNYIDSAGGGGGWGASGGASALNFAAGGVGGKAIALNGFTATRTGAGTTYGAVS